MKRLKIKRPRRLRGLCTLGERDHFRRHPPGRHFEHRVAAFLVADKANDGAGLIANWEGNSPAQEARADMKANAQAGRILVRYPERRHFVGVGELGGDSVGVEAVGLFTGAGKKCAGAGGRLSLRCPTLRLLWSCSRRCFAPGGSRCLDMSSAKDPDESHPKIDKRERHHW